MATKEQVTEYVNGQFDESDQSNWEYWEDPIGGGTPGNRISLVQNWMSPEIAGILQKLVGNALMVSRISKNGSNV
jgi:hypothetical protein